MKLVLLVLMVTLVAPICKGFLDNRLHNYDIIHNVHVHSRTKRSPGSAPKTEVELSMFGKNFTLELQPSRDLFTKDFKIILVSGDNTEKLVSGFDQTHFYTGHVRGETKSRATIHLSENNMVTGAFTAGGEEYYMEPLHRHIDQPEDDFHDRSTMVGYRKSDIKQDCTEPNVCGAVHPNFTDDVFHEIKFDQYNPGDKEQGRYRRATARKTACPVVAVADYKFYQMVGRNDNFTTANYIANIFSRVNSIYRTTDFGLGTGYGVEIDTMIIHTEASTSSNVYPYNVLKNNWGTMELLETLGQADQYKDYCLAHLFTYQQFSGTLGLSYIASSKSGTLGGICSPTRRTNGETQIFNIAWTSLVNSGGNTLLFTEAALITAHGHNFGSEHDPSSGDCAPYFIFGGKYLMYTYSVTGDEENNDMFSQCSRSSIGAVLANKANICFKEPAEESLCGNGRVDPGEDCDGGFLGRIGQNNKCCTQDCQFTTAAICSPDNSPCCNEECQIATPGKPCSSSQDFSCLEASECDGSSIECPVGANKPDGTSCLDGGSCLFGVCQPFCEYRGFNTCVCETVDTSCKRCCVDETTGECAVHTDFFTNTFVNHNDGRPCVQGVCLSGECTKVENDLVARLWGLIDKISVDFLIESFKDNMVGCVVGFSLLIYIPICIGVWCYDRSRKKKWEKENSFTVRKDRTLAHDEDKRPVGSSERPESRSRPSTLNTSDYMVPLPRRPGSGSRNQIQPLDHKPSSSHA